MPRLRSDFDTAWKEVLHDYLPLAILFFFRNIYEEVDWSKQPEFLEQELRQAIRRQRKGLMVVDVLVKVWRKSGEPMWVLLHVEVQSQQVPDFESYMYACNALITRKLGCPVVSLGILGDDQPDWRPERYHYSMWGCEVDFKFPVVKLLDYKERWEDLERSDNPFALAVMAQLLTHATQGNFEERKVFKFEMVRRLLERGHDWTTIQRFFRFLNLVMVLPAKLEEELENDVSRYEKERKMPVLTQFEKNAMRKGALPVARAAVLDVLRVRFGRLPRGLAQRVDAISGLPTLRRLLEAAATIGSLEEFQAKLPAQR